MYLYSISQSGIIKLNVKRVMGRFKFRFYYLHSKAMPLVMESGWFRIDWRRNRVLHLYFIRFNWILGNYCIIVIVELDREYQWHSASRVSL